LAIERDQNAAGDGGLEDKAMDRRPSSATETKDVPDNEIELHPAEAAIQMESDPE
jgi:hypothetical protein